LEEIPDMDDVTFWQMMFQMIFDDKNDSRYRFELHNEVVRRGIEAGALVGFGDPENGYVAALTGLSSELKAYIGGTTGGEL
jgi:hypothetical protein